MGEIRAIAKKLSTSDTNNRLSFIAAPWTNEDGKAFPDGQHIVFTHWTADQDDRPSRRASGSTAPRPAARRSSSS